MKHILCCDSAWRGIRGLCVQAKAKDKDFVIKAKAKATALCLRGASRTRPSPGGHVTGYNQIFAKLLCEVKLTW